MKTKITKFDKTSIQKKVKEFLNWKKELKKYWSQIDANQELYEFYRKEGETNNNISLNTPFSIVESIISRTNDTNINITVKAKGENNLVELGDYIASIVKGIIDDPDVAQIHGTFRKIKEMFVREFLVKGNAVGIVEYCYKKQGGKVIADNPYIRILNLKNVIFNPTKTLSTSDKYYIESFVNYDDLVKNEYDNKTGKGLYKNLGALKKFQDEKMKDEEGQFFISGAKKIQKKVKPIKIIEVIDGARYIVIADDKIVIRTEYNQFKTGGHTLLTAMNYVQVDRPYAYGEIDAIYKPTIAQDTIVNQSMDMVNRYLRPSILVNDPNVNLDELIIIIENGGVMNGDPEGIGAVPQNVPPTQAFQTIDIMQQAVERAARWSPYASGLPSQQSDKTQGTKGGIQSLQQASEPNFQVKLDAIEESFLEPFARIALKMVANMIGKDDIRYGLLKNKRQQWVSATKGILLGKATISDMVMIGLMSEEEAQEYLTMQDPITGQPIPIPGADKAYIFDIDWLINAKFDNQSKVAKEQETQKKIELIQLGSQLGVQWNPDRVITRLAEEQGLEDVDELMLTEEEKQQQIQQQQAQIVQEQQIQGQQQMAMQKEKAKSDLMREYIKQPTL